MAKAFHKVFSFVNDTSKRNAVSYRLLNGQYRTRFFVGDNRIAKYERDFDRWKDAIRECEKWISK